MSQMIGVYYVIAALEQLIATADPAARDYVAKTIEAYSDDNVGA